MPEQVLQAAGLHAEGRKPLAASSYVTFDATSPMAAQCARDLKGLLVDADERLLTWFGVEPHGGPQDPDLAGWLGQAAANPAHDRWAGLAADYMTTGVLGGRQAVLLLPAAALVGPGAEALDRALGSAPPGFRSFLLLFLDEGGELLGPDVRQEVLEGWRQRLAGNPRRSVQAYLVTAALENDTPVPAEEVTHATAAAVAADLVVPGHDRRRVLSGTPRPGVARLGTLGARVLRLSPRRLTDRLAPRLAADLLRRTVFASNPHVPVVEVPCAGWEAIGRVVPSDLPDAPGLLREHSRTARPGSPPWVVGSDYAAAVDLGALRQGLRLGGMARRLWAAMVHEWDYVLRRSRIPRWLPEIRRRFERLEREEAQEIREALSRVATEAGAQQHLARFVDEMKVRVAFEFVGTVEGRGESTLAADLDRLEDALQAIPHLPGLVLRGASVAGVLAMVALHALGADPGPARRGILMGVGATAVLLLASTVGARMAGSARAQSARSRALANAEGRARGDVCDAIRRGLEEVRGRLESEVETVGGLLQEVLVAWQQVLADGVPARPSQGTVVEWAPDPPAEGAHYLRKVGREVESGALDPVFGRLLREVAAGVASRKRPVSASGAPIRDWAWGEVHRRLSETDRLWMHLRDGEEAGAGASPARIRAALERLAPDRGRVFCRGPVVTHAMLDPSRRRHVLITPHGLPAVAHPRIEETWAGADPRLLLAVTTVSLAEPTEEGAVLPGGTA